jgi:tRNA pseudouridine38-40 synthase
MRLRLTIAYDGTPFRGWQSQPGGRTIQDILEAAATTILAQPVSIQGSGRTDAGVHANGQVAHFDVPDSCRMDPSAWLRALNVHLPPEIRIMAATATSPAFHSRFDAIGKTYRYHLWNAPVLPPLMHNRAWHVPHALDLSLLESATRLLTGTHDFAAFAAFRGDPRSDADTIRTIHSASLSTSGPDLSLTWSGNGFLYRMVRMLVGGMIRVAQGKDTRECFARRLAAGKAWPNPAMAPAEGLYLVRALYGTASVPKGQGGKKALSPSA